MFLIAIPFNAQTKVPQTMPRTTFMVLYGHTPADLVIYFPDSKIVSDRKHWNTEEVFINEIYRVPFKLKNMPQNTKSQPSATKPVKPLDQIIRTVREIDCFIFYIVQRIGRKPILKPIVRFYEHFS